jgi:hypothetical protein
LIRTILLVLSIWIGVCRFLEPLPAAEQVPPTEKPGEETVQNGAGLPSAPVTMAGIDGAGKSVWIHRAFVWPVPFETPPDFRITYIDVVAVRNGKEGSLDPGMLKNEGRGTCGIFI